MSPASDAFQSDASGVSHGFSTTCLVTLEVPKRAVGSIMIVGFGFEG